MAIKGQGSDIQVVKEREYYTGLAVLQVVAVNPTKEMLKTLVGIETEKEPEYITTDQETGIVSCRVDFWLKVSKDRKVTYKDGKTGEIKELPKDIVFKTSIWVKDNFRYSSTGKTLVINKYGQSTWAEVDDNKEIKGVSDAIAKWFNTEGMRKAYQGEDELTSFLLSWLNVSKDGECQLERTADLFKGSFAELYALFKAFPKNEIRVLLTVRENISKSEFYQDVYTRKTSRATETKNTAWATHFSKEPMYQSDNTKIHYSLDLQTLDPEPTKLESKRYTANNFVDEDDFFKD